MVIFWRWRMHQAGRAAKALALVGLWTAAGMAQAQGSRLSGLLELSMTAHPTVLQARSQAQAAGFEADAAKWSRFPSVSSELRSDSAYTQSIAKVEQPLWAGGRITARVAAGEAGLRAAQAGVLEAQINTLSQVGTAFFEVVRLQERMQLADENVSEHQRLYEMIARRIDAQISPPADGTLAQARLQQALTERLQIKKQLEAGRGSLTQWAGPIASSLTAPRSLAYVRAESAADALERARNTSGQRQKLQAQIENSQAQIQLAKAQAWPTVVAGVQHVLQGPASGRADRTRAYVGLQYQPGAGLSAMAGVEAAVAKKAAAEQELLALERSLDNQVGTLYGEIDVLQSQLGPARQLTDKTGELVDSYVRQYQIGRKNWLDVLNVLREKTQALYNLADVQNALMVAQLRLLILTGQLDGQNLTLIHE